MSLHMLYSLSSSCPGRLFFFFLMSDPFFPFFLWTSCSILAPSLFSFFLSACRHLIITFLFKCLSFFLTHRWIQSSQGDIQGYSNLVSGALCFFFFVFFHSCQTMLLPNIIIIYSIFTIEFCPGQRGHSLPCFNAIAAFQFPLYCFSSCSSQLCIIYSQCTLDALKYYIRIQ